LFLCIKKKFEINLSKDEQIKDVKGFEGRFIITNHGRLFSINGKWKGVHEVGNHVDQLGYKFTTLRMNPKYRQVRLHQLVAENFIPNLENKPQINHKDGNKLNNHYLNLEWCTISENMKHAFRIGLIDRKGEKHENAKLKNSDIPKIFKLRKQGLIMRVIGNHFGVNRRTISDVLDGSCWSHISGL